MKVFLLFTIAIYGAFAALSSEFVASEWTNFKIKFNKNFVNVKEEAFRKQIFQKNIERYEAHNKLYEQGLETYTLGINHFSDMTPDEILPYTHGLIEPKEIPKPTIEIKSRQDLAISENVQIPASFDWRDSGVVTPVKNQGACGSCWAFSSSGAIEAQERLAYGANLDISVSEQQLVDCVSKAYGCQGGWMTDAYVYVAQNGGIDSESAYPYEADNKTCRFKPNQVAARLTGYAYLTEPNEDMLADMVANKGPVSVAFDASGDFGAYSGGVYYNATCDPYNFTHAVLIVGYGTENGQDYWLVKNSWGDKWGLNGYFKIARNRNNNCGIANKASYPVL